MGGDFIKEDECHNMLAPICKLTRAVTATRTGPQNRPWRRARWRIDANVFAAGYDEHLIRQIGMTPDVARD